MNRTLIKPAGVVVVSMLMMVACSGSAPELKTSQPTELPSVVDTSASSSDLESARSALFENDVAKARVELKKREDVLMPQTWREHLSFATTFACNSRISGAYSPPFETEVYLDAVYFVSGDYYDMYWRADIDNGWPKSIFEAMKMTCPDPISGKMGG